MVVDVVVDVVEGKGESITVVGSVQIGARSDKVGDLDLV